MTSFRPYPSWTTTSAPVLPRPGGSQSTPSICPPAFVEKLTFVVMCLSSSIGNRSNAALSTFAPLVETYVYQARAVWSARVADPVNCRNHGRPLDVGAACSDCCDARGQAWRLEG